MDTSTFPTSTFKLTEPIELGSVPADGTQVTASATGELTLRGTTKAVTFDVQAAKDGSTIKVVGQIPIVFDDWGIPNPSFGPARPRTTGSSSSRWSSRRGSPVTTPGAFNWMQRYAGEEVVEHAREGRLTRREMMRQLVAIAGTAAGGAALLAACGGDGAATPASTSGTAATSTAPPSSTSAPGPATGASPVEEVSSTLVVPPTNPGAPAILSVAPDDPAVRAEDVTFPGPAGTMLGYLARPSADGTRAAVIVIHEIFGLTDHIRDVARRLAKAGYLALAPDLASRAGGTDEAANVSGALTQGPVEDRVADLDAALAYLGQQPDADGKVGVVGFCFGGGMTLSYAAAQPEVLAAVSYYGPTPQPPSVMSATNAAILANYGAEDARVNAGIADLEAAMAGKTFEKRLYDGVRHAFNNDTARLLQTKRRRWPPGPRPWSGSAATSPERPRSGSCRRWRWTPCAVGVGDLVERVAGVDDRHERPRSRTAGASRRRSAG